MSSESESSSPTKSEKTKKVFNEEDVALLSQKAPISILQEICIRKGLIPRYDLFQIEGAVHKPTFKYRVTVGDLVAVGSGATKQKAKHFAATSMIENLKLLSVSNPEMSETVTKVVSDFPCFDELNITMPNQSQISGNPIGDLQVYCSSLEKRQPTYTLTKSEGPSHNPHFEIVCSFNKSLAETGAGKTKKQAKKEAAFKMLTVIKSMPSAAVQEALDACDVSPNDVYSSDVSLNDVSALDSSLNDDKLSTEMDRKMKLSEEGSQKQLNLNVKTSFDSEQFKFMFQTNPEEALKKVASEQGRSLRLVDVAEKSMTGKFIFFAQIETPNSVVVFTGIGDSPETARAESCRNGLEYFRLVSEKS